jgi:plasmid stabilization system protein ParE
MELNESCTVKFLPAAINDMSEIISSFAMLGSKQGAQRIRSKMIKASEQIKAHPYSGVTVPDEKLAKSGYRMLVVESYLMFYKVFDEAKQVIFYRVVNGKRNFPMLFSRLHEDFSKGEQLLVDRK